MKRQSKGKNSSVRKSTEIKHFNGVTVYAPGPDGKTRVRTYFVRAKSGFKKRLQTL